MVSRPPSVEHRVGLTTRVMRASVAGVADPRVPVVARHCLLDWLGAALRGAHDPSVRSIAAATASWSGGGGGSTVIGRRATAGAFDAALLNGVAGHVLELDDTNRSAIHGHASAALLPALLALAEQRDLAIADLASALAAGVAGAAALGAHLNPAHYDAGWHATATLGTVGAALACTALIGADARRAIGHAALQASGLVLAFGTPGKPLQVGRAAANGLAAALLAEEGVDAPGEALDGARGMAALYAGRPGDWPRAGAHPLLATSFKLHASCHGTHAAIDAVSALRDAQGLEPGAIAALEITVSPALLAVCDLPNPRTGQEARFSLRATAALTLAGADTRDPCTFTRARVREPAVRRLMGNTTVVADPGLDDWQARVRLRLADGRTLTGGAALPSPCADLEAQERMLRDKFARLVAPVLPERRAVAIACLVLAPEADAAGARELTALLRVGAPVSPPRR